MLRQSSIECSDLLRRSQDSRSRCNAVAGRCGIEQWMTAPADEALELLAPTARRHAQNRCRPAKKKTKPLNRWAQYRLGARKMMANAEFDYILRKMSRAFVRGTKPSRICLTGSSPNFPNDVTKEGMAQINAALAAARTAYAGAQAANDRAAMAATLRELRYWNARRATARIVLNSADATQVRFGSSVTILRDDGREQTFRIVGEDEANPSRGTISHVSPLARALFWKTRWRTC